MSLNVSKYFSGKLTYISCGKGLKRGLVGEFVDEYISMDHEVYPHGTGVIDLVEESQNIPIDDVTFDIHKKHSMRPIVFSSQVDKSCTPLP
jgi:hypothetical protein